MSATNPLPMMPMPTLSMTPPSPHPAASGHAPGPLDATPAAVGDLVVQVDGRAHVAGDHPDLLPDPGRGRDLHVPVLLVHFFHAPVRPLGEESEAAHVHGGVAGDGLAAAVDQALAGHRGAHHPDQDPHGALLAGGEPVGV